MREFLILLHYRFLAYRHGAAGARRSLARVGLLGYACFILFNLALSALVFSVLLPAVEPRFREVLLSLLAQGLSLGAAAIALSVAGNTALAGLYEAPHLALLLAQPVGTWAVHLAGMADVAAAALGLVFGLIAPAWVALGLASGSDPGFISVGLTGLALETLLCAAGVSLALGLILCRVRAAWLRRAMVAALVAGMAALVLALEAAGIGMLRLGVPALMLRAHRVMDAFSFLPHGLAAGAALAARGGGGAWLPRLGLLFVLTAGVSAAATIIGGRIYLAGWSNAQETGARAAGPRAAAGARKGRPRPLLAMLAKDWLILAREPLFWADLLVFVLGISFYAWSAGRNPEFAKGADPALQAFHFFFASFFVIGWLALAGGMAISREGSSWWRVQAFPLSGRSLATAKLWFGATGAGAFLCQAWAVFALAGLALPPPGISLVILAGITAAFTGAGLLADLALPDFTLRLGIKMSGAHGGGKAKIVLAMAAGLAVSFATGITYLLASFAAGPLAAAALVLLEGCAVLALAAAFGGVLLDRLLVSAS